MRADWLLYRRLLQFAFRFWPVMVALTLAVIVAAVMEPMLPALMKPLVDESLSSRNPGSLWIIPSLLVLVVFVRGVADYAVTFCSQYLANRTVEDLRQALFSKQLSLSLTQHADEQSGRMLTRITYDPQMVAEAVSEVWMVLIRDSLILLGLIGFLFFTAWELATMVFISMPILFLLIRRLSQRLRVSSAAVQERFGALNGTLQESLLGLREVKIFGAEIEHERRFFRANQSLRKEQMRVVRISAVAGPLVAVLTALTVATVIYVASVITAAGQLTVGEFISFITALAMVFGPVRRLTSINITLQRGLAAADAIFQLLDALDEKGLQPAPTVLIQRHLGNPSPAPSERIRGNIRFADVTFVYPNQTASGLFNFSCQISPGEVVAFTGASGSGKSTIFALLCRFYEPTEGSITVDGRPLYRWALDDLRANLALVGQNVTLFDDTIRNNIRMGRSSASDQDVVAAARAANALDFIEKFPNGLDTHLGALGDRLSGGQRQRIAIARAFVKDAPILLLDEATSALDRDSEEAVMDGLESLIQGRTVLVATHAPERFRGITRRVQIDLLKNNSAK